jgi:L-aminopeptidase/D-esterase-like protein
MKEDGTYTGHHTQLANIAGAIIYDFGDRRLNEVHPDAALGAAAFRSAREGVFPLGSQGQGAWPFMEYSMAYHSIPGRARHFARSGR